MRLLANNEAVRKEKVLFRGTNTIPALVPSEDYFPLKKIFFYKEQEELLK